MHSGQPILIAMQIANLLLAGAMNDRWCVKWTRTRNAVFRRAATFRAFRTCSNSVLRLLDATSGYSQAYCGTLRDVEPENNTEHRSCCADHWFESHRRIGSSARNTDAPRAALSPGASICSTNVDCMDEHCDSSSDLSAFRQREIEHGETMPATFRGQVRRRRPPSNRSLCKLDRKDDHAIGPEVMRASFSSEFAWSVKIQQSRTRHAPTSGE
ncbi:hypothetical protein C8T65DRAFT_23023 [Cerioporus squamosus]|nr:hypothetical protein C8T65DRAFT_23023 [Cerioporus squamosus]